MSDIEYSDLIFKISERLDELNVRERLIFMCRRKLASGSEDSIHDALSLFKELEERDCLGPDRLEIVKDVLKNVEEWFLFGKVKRFESKRKEYIGLLEHIIAVLDELNDLERLISICRGSIPEANEGNIHDVQSLFKELENHNCLGIDYLGFLKEILTQTEQSDLLKEVDKFEERRNQEDEFQTRKAQASAFVSSVGNTLIGVLNLKTVFKVVAGGIITASTLDVWSRGSSFDQLVTAVDRCVLPAGTSLLQITEGCVCLTVQAENLSALNTLWSLYQDGTLKARLQTFFVTDELKELAGGEEVEAIVTIEEQEYERACVELRGKVQDASSLQEERRTTLRRWNSDSSLYCKAGEGLTERKAQPEKPVKDQAKYLDQEKLAFVQDYLEQADDTRSMTTETSDSGMPGTHGAPSELGMDETSDAAYNLCLKDLSDEMVREVTLRLEGDPSSEERFRKSFGLYSKRKFQPELAVSDIKKLFPDTPVRLLKEVCEALQLYDLVELLEKAKPRALRPALPLKEIECLPKAIHRLTTFYSRASVLIIDNGKDDSAERIESSFKTLNSGSEVITITVAQLVTKLRALRRVKNKKEGMLQSWPYYYYEKQLREDLELVKSRSRNNPREFPGASARHQWLKNELEKLLQRKVQWMKQNLDSVEKELRQNEEELQKEREEFHMALSTVVNKWVKQEDVQSTLFVVFDVCSGIFSRNAEIDQNSDEKIVERLTKMLAVIPDARKVVISCLSTDPFDELSNTLHVVYKDLSDRSRFVASLLEILSKRWQTLDIISVMQEVQRNMFAIQHRNFADDYSELYGEYYYHVNRVIIKDSLRSIPRLQKTDKTSE